MFTCLAILPAHYGDNQLGTFWVWDARITSMVILAFFTNNDHDKLTLEEKVNKINSRQR